MGSAQATFGAEMSRTEVQSAAEAVITAADAWYETREDTEQRYLVNAVYRWRAAVAQQDALDAEVYLRRGAKTVDREAAAAAMIARPGWRKLIYEMISWSTRWNEGLSDRRIEVLFGMYPNHGPVDLTHPPGKPTHQTISSARKSLVDAGLVYAFGVEIVEGRQHNLWRTR